MRNLIATLLAAVIISGCSSGKEASGNISFSRTDFMETKELKDAEEIVIDSLLYPASFRIINDSILVASNQPICEYMLEFYSLNTLKPIARMIQKGNGPDDMLSCYLNLHSSESPCFSLADGNMKKCYHVNIDTLLAYNKLKPLHSFRYSSEINPTTSVLEHDANTYIGCNMWYAPDKEYDNGIPEPLSFFKKNVDSQKTMADYKYFTAPVTGLLLLRNPKNGRVWAADKHRDRICIYNDSLQLISTLDGPDHFDISYEIAQSNSPVPFVTFTNKRDIHSYSDYFITDQYIYLLYEGTEHFNPMELSPVEVFKFDFSGHPLCNYKFDRYIYSISVNRDNTYLYCAARKNVKEPPVLLKYKL